MQGNRVQFRCLAIILFNQSSISRIRLGNLVDRIYTGFPASHLWPCCRSRLRCRFWAPFSRTGSLLDSPRYDDDKPLHYILANHIGSRLSCRSWYGMLGYVLRGSSAALLSESECVGNWHRYRRWQCGSVSPLNKLQMVIC